MTAVRVMGSEYLASLKKADFDVMEAKIQEASMICKGIKRLCADPTPQREGVEDYESMVSTYLSLEKAASFFRHPIDVG